jgi:hypothetical protein
MNLEAQIMRLKTNGHATGHTPVRIRNNILMRKQYTLLNADTGDLLGTINASTPEGELLIGALAIGTEVLSIELIDETINIVDNDSGDSATKETGE